MSSEHAVFVGVYGDVEKGMSSEHAVFVGVYGDVEKGMSSERAVLVAYQASAFVVDFFFFLLSLCVQSEESIV